MKLRRAEQVVSMLGSLPPFSFRKLQPCKRKSTKRAGVSRVRSTFLGPSSAERWHRAGRRYLESVSNRDMMGGDGIICGMMTREVKDTKVTMGKNDGDGGRMGMVMKTMGVQCTY